MGVPMFEKKLRGKKKKKGKRKENLISTFKKKKEIEDIFSFLSHPTSAFNLFFLKKERKKKEKERKRKQDLLQNGDARQKMGTPDREKKKARPSPKWGRQTEN